MIGGAPNSINRHASTARSLLWVTTRHPLLDGAKGHQACALKNCPRPAETPESQFAEELGQARRGQASRNEIFARREGAAAASSHSWRGSRGRRSRARFITSTIAETTGTRCSRRRRRRRRSSGVCSKRASGWGGGCTRLSASPGRGQFGAPVSEPRASHKNQNSGGLTPMSARQPLVPAAGAKGAQCLTSLVWPR